MLAPDVALVDVDLQWFSVLLISGIAYLNPHIRHIETEIPDAIPDLPEGRESPASVTLPTEI